MPTDTNQLAGIAYEAVDGIDTVEPNDRERLGYHVYLYLTGEFRSVKEAVSAARSRIIDSDDRVVNIITERLTAQGMINR